MNSLNRLRSPLARLLTRPSMSPAFLEPVEGHDAGIGRTVGAAPGDALVGRLLGDLGVPLALLTGDLSHPVDLGVGDLTDLLDTLHELGELLELRPLVVGRADGH